MNTNTYIHWFIKHLRQLFIFGIILNICNVSGQKNIVKELNAGWLIQSSANIKADGKSISSLGFDTRLWHAAAVPGTILSSLVKDSIYKNIFFDTKLARIPFKIFDTSWWYRCTFELPKINSAENIRLAFNGINYKADIWLNGYKIGSHDSVAGGFRRFNFDITKYAKQGKNNLAVLITRPQKGDLTLGFVDWNPEPPDHSMGIWRDVVIKISGPVSIQNTFVRADLDTLAYNKASLTVHTGLQNNSGKIINGILSVSIGHDIQINKQITLNPNETKSIELTPSDFSKLIISHPKLWWVYTLGKPNLYHVSVKFIVNKIMVMDSACFALGIRNVSTYFTSKGFRGFKLNGQKILIKGGGWVDPMLLSATPDYVRANIDYVKQMNLNTLRMEGFWGNDSRIYDMCDSMGILIMAGLSCQWEWEEYLGTPGYDQNEIYTPQQNATAIASFQEQVIWLRNHPSIFTWLYGSDKFPRPALESQYLAILKQYDPDRPCIASAAEYTSTISGNTGVKMRGPYDYVPPVYWYADSLYGGAFGFNTETSPGPEIPVLESLKKMIPADSLWPISQSWIFHTARHDFNNLTAYNNAMNERLGAPTGLDDYIRKAQYLNYEGMRAMYEAFEANRFDATGIIQWMLNASWPKLWWQLYDYYLMPTAAFYAARKANEPVHILYNYGSGEIEIINNTLKQYQSFYAGIKLIDADMKPIIDTNFHINIMKSNTALDIFNITDELRNNQNHRQVRFLRLALKNKDGKEIGNNFYVLPAKTDSIDEKASNWYITPQSQYADIKMLQDLPVIQLKRDKTIVSDRDNVSVSVRLKNTSASLAFMVHINMIDKINKQSVVPVFWDDNYITLLPSEATEIKGYCRKKDLKGNPIEITVDGWNIQPATVL